MHHLVTTSACCDTEAHWRAWRQQQQVDDVEYDIEVLEVEVEPHVSFVD